MIEEKDDNFTTEILKPLSDGVNRVQNNDSPRKICGVGFVVLSPEISKAEHVAKCYKNNVLTIITDRNEIIKDCYVSREVWQYVKFPSNSAQKGSMIFWINPPHENKPFILSVINKRDELIDSREENSFSFSRKSAEGNTTIEGLENGILKFLLSGESDLDGKLIVKILNSLTKGILDLYVQGNINVECDDTISFKIKSGMKVQIINEEDNTKQANISYVLGEGFKYTDEFNNEIDVNKDGGEIIVDKKNKVKIHEINADTEPALLGNKTTDVFNDLKGYLKTLRSDFSIALATGSFAAFVTSMTPKLIVFDTNLTLLQKKIDIIKSKNVELS